ncbi:MAG: hypothetical protein J6L96_01810, partial [Clostridia bacterium]|nr:hypothetical protein [Clostridia bacterium]
YHYIADISYTGSELAITNTVSENVIGQATVLDMNTKNMRYLYPTDSRGMFAITDADDGYYVAYQRANLAPEGVPIELESEYNGVWYAKVGEKPVKISDAYYSELYYVNGKLVGVYRDTVELIDTDPDTVTEFPDSREQYNDDAHREIGSKVNAAIDELYNDTIEANGGEVPKYLDSDYIATLNIGNYSSVQRQTLRYEEKCSWAIEETLEENLPEKCIMSHIPIWEIESGVIAEESDIRYFILDESLISDEIDKEELVLYLEYSYHQSRRKKHDFSQYYDIDVKALAEKYGDMGTVAVYKYGSWEYWDTGTGVMKSIERYPNYNEISALYYNFMMKD